MREVAERADVAISSVSRVLSGHPDVSDKMRDRVLAAVAELEYEPDFLAQSLRRGQTLSVGFVLGDISNPLLSDIVLGAETELRKAGYSLLLMNSENDPELDVRSIGFFETRRVDGMLLSTVGESAPDLLQALRRVRVPVVLVDREVPADIGASMVQNDHASGMVEAVRHLIALGHRRIALIGGSRDTAPGRAREQALHLAVEEQPEPVERAACWLARSRATTARRRHGPLLDGPKPPTAIVCGSNQLLVGCLRVLNERDIRVGARHLRGDLRRGPGLRAVPAAHRRHHTRPRRAGPDGRGAAGAPPPRRTPSARDEWCCRRTSSPATPAPRRPPPRTTHGEGGPEGRALDAEAWPSAPRSNPGRGASPRHRPRLARVGHPWVRRRRPR